VIANLKSYNACDAHDLYATRFAIIFHCTSDDSQRMVTTHHSRERCDIYDKCCNLFRSHMQFYLFLRTAINVVAKAD